MPSPTGPPLLLLGALVESEIPAARRRVRRALRALLPADERGPQLDADADAAGDDAAFDARLEARLSNQFAAMESLLGTLSSSSQFLSSLLT